MIGELRTRPGTQDYTYFIDSVDIGTIAGIKIEAGYWIVRTYYSKPRRDVATIPTKIPGTQPCPIELAMSLIALRWEG